MHNNKYIQVTLQPMALWLNSESSQCMYAKYRKVLLFYSFQIKFKHQG